MQLHSRQIKDLNFISTVALAGAGANTGAFDLGQVQGGLIEGVQVELQIPAVPGLTDAKVFTFQLQDSADGTNWAAVDPAITTTTTGVGGGGSPAKTVEFRLPPKVRRYIRIAQTVTATPGTVTGNMVASLLF